MEETGPAHDRFVCVRECIVSVQIHEECEEENPRNVKRKRQYG